MLLLIPRKELLRPCSLRRYIRLGLMIAYGQWHSAHSQVDPGTYEPLDLKAFMERGDLPLEIVGKYQYGVAKKTIEVHYSDPRHWKNARPEGWTFEQSEEDDEDEK